MPRQVLALAGVHTFSMNSGLTTEDFGWGSKNFHKMVCAPRVGLHCSHLFVMIRSCITAMACMEPQCIWACLSSGLVGAQGREKINLVYQFTKMGFSILVSDVDTVWMRNPLPYMAQYPEADVLTSSDHLVRRCMIPLQRLQLPWLRRSSAHVS